MTECEKIYQTLLNAYGPQGWWPLINREEMPLVCSYTGLNTVKVKTPAEVFEICAGAILTQNTNWSNAERALVSLVSGNLLDPAFLSAAEPGEIAKLITSSGYYNQKAKKLKAFSSFFLKSPAPSRTLFLEQWGLGPETVDDMLLYAYDQPVFVIDLYTKRLFSRLGRCPENISYEALQYLISGGIEKDVILYKEYHALIVRQAKEHCRKVPDCRDCPLSACCRYPSINPAVL